MSQFWEKGIYLVCALLLMACQQRDDAAVPVQPVKTLTIAVSKTPLSTPLYVAKAKGLFAKHGLDVTFKEINGGHLCFKALLSGEADLATSSDYVVMINSFSRSDYAVVTTFVSSDNDVKLMTSLEHGVMRPIQLKNKKVGVVKGGSSMFFLNRFLLLNGMNMKDVKLVHLEPAEMPLALKQGKVDAISVWEPYGYLSHALLGDNLLIYPSKNYYLETFNLVGKKAYIAAEDDALNKLVQALVDATEFIHQQPFEAQQIIIDALGLDRSFVNWVWKDYDFSVGMDQTLLSTLENEARWALQNKVVKTSKMPKIRSVIDPSILLNIDRSRVTLIGNRH